MTAFEALRDLQVAVVALRTILRRVPGTTCKEVAAVTLHEPLQQIEDATQDIERWLDAHGKFVMQQVTIHYPDEEAR